MSKMYGIRFSIDSDESINFEKFNNNKNLIDELKELANKYDNRIAIGFDDDDYLLCKGDIICYTKEEAKAKFRLFKAEYKRIIKRYYKIKLINKFEMQFTTI